MIPIEFIPGFWVTHPSGLEGRGSGFLMAENIRSVFSVDYTIPSGKWNVISMTEDELQKKNYLDAIIRIISESWLETRSIIIIGSENNIRKLLVHYLGVVARMNFQVANKVISSKINIS
jgi:hypothetical protein